MWPQIFAGFSVTVVLLLLLGLRHLLADRRTESRRAYRVYLVRVIDDNDHNNRDALPEWPTEL